MRYAPIIHLLATCRTHSDQHTFAFDIIRGACPVPGVFANDSVEYC